MVLAEGGGVLTSSGAAADIYYCASNELVRAPNDTDQIETDRIFSILFPSSLRAVFFIRFLFAFFSAASDFEAAFARGLRCREPP